MNQPSSNEKASLALAAYLHSGRLPHAVLLEGPAGQGKSAFAREIAAGALCTAPAEKRPCGVCRDCVKVQKEIHPDVIVYAGDGGSRSFHVEKVRAIRQEAYVRAGEGSCKVLILKDVQEMTPQAGNALLKVLEEPPRGVVFVLTCENKSALLDTILSRVSVIELRSSSPIEQAPAAPDEDSAQEVLQLLYLGSELQALAVLARFEKDKEGFSAFLERMADCVRRQLRAKPGNDDSKQLARRATPLQLIQILAIIEETSAAVSGNVNRLLLVTNLSAAIKLILSR